MATEKQKAAGRKNLAAGQKRITTSERGAELQKKSAQKRKENRLAREILAEMLAKNNRKQMGLDALAEKYSTGDLAAVKLTQEILEEAENRTVVDFNIKVNFGDE